MPLDRVNRHCELEVLLKSSHASGGFLFAASCKASLEVAEQSDQDNDWDGNAEHQQQNGTHIFSPLRSLLRKFNFHAIGALSRCLPPIVAAILAQKAPIKSARNVQYIECATAFRAASAASRACA
jgi:hypothetical protein